LSWGLYSFCLQVEKVVDRIVEVEKERIVDRFVEVEKERIVERIVEVPVDRVVVKEVPVEVQVEKIVERFVEVDREVIVEKEVVREVPVERIVVKEVPVEVDRIVHVDVQPEECSICRSVLDVQSKECHVCPLVQRLNCPQAPVIVSQAGLRWSASDSDEIIIQVVHSQRGAFPRRITLYADFVPVHDLVRFKKPHTIGKSTYCKGKRRRLAKVLPRHVVRDHRRY
jgi:hypothetical protein